MDCYGNEKVFKFAEIIAGTVLAGELSLMGALAAGHLARAHKDLGRGLISFLFFVLVTILYTNTVIKFNSEIVIII